MSVLHKALHHRRRTPSIWQFGFHCALLAACLLISVPVASAQSRVGLEVEFRDIRSLNLTEKRALAVTIQKRLQRIVDNMMPFPGQAPYTTRSEEHTSELQSLMRKQNAVFCLTKKTNTHTTHKK